MNQRREGERELSPPSMVDPTCVGLDMTPLAGPPGAISLPVSASTPSLLWHMLAACCCVLHTPLPAGQPASQPAGPKGPAPPVSPPPPSQSSDTSNFDPPTLREQEQGEKVGGVVGAAQQDAKQRVKPHHTCHAMPFPLTGQPSKPRSNQCERATTNNPHSQSPKPP